MPPPHTGPELAQKISHIFVDWNIYRKVFTFKDNASANNAMVKLLKTQLWLQNSLLCNSEYFYVRRCTHFIVQEWLK